jgi:hypothetical protein
MKRATNLIGILIVLLVIFYTKATGLSNTYQDSFFTTEGKIDRNNDKIGGYTFKFGGTIEDIQHWERYRMGYPLGAVTIDHNQKAKITQGRIQTDAIIFNLIFGLILFILSKILLKILKAVKKYVDNSRLFQRDRI